MSTTYISAELRRLVRQRSEGLCEYCLIHEGDASLAHTIDHIISEKHGGPTAFANLTYACVFCNRYKGSDVGSVVPGTLRFSRFYNPRLDRWADHFTLAEDGVTIRSLTEIGEATVRIFAFNSDDRLQEREALRQAGSYPSEAAQRKMEGQG